MFEAGAYSDRIPAIMEAHLQEKGYVTPIDVLLGLDILSKRVVRHWQCGYVPYLEKLCQCGFSDISIVFREMRSYAGNRQLTPSMKHYESRPHPQTGYRRRLRFSKNNLPRLEQLYATHYLDRNRLRELGTESGAT